MNVAFVEVYGRLELILMMNIWTLKGEHHHPF